MTVFLKWWSLKSLLMFGGQTRSTVETWNTDERVWRKRSGFLGRNLLSFLKRTLECFIHVVSLDIFITTKDRMSESNLRVKKSMRSANATRQSPAARRSILAPSSSFVSVFVACSSIVSPSREVSSAGKTLWLTHCTPHRQHPKACRNKLNVSTFKQPKEM